MSVQAIRTEIRAALLDGVLTDIEARAIIAAAKHNVRADEVREFEALSRRVKSGEIDAIADSEPIGTLLDYNKNLTGCECRSVGVPNGIF